MLFVSYEGGESLVLAKGCAVPCRLLASYRPTVRGIPGGALSQLSLCFSFFGSDTDGLPRAATAWGLTVGWRLLWAGRTRLVSSSQRTKSL